MPVMMCSSRVHEELGCTLTSVKIRKFANALEADLVMTSKVGANIFDQGSHCLLATKEEESQA